jgi:hypothetical protein
LVTWDEVTKSDFQFVADIDNLSFESPAPLEPGPDGIYAAPTPGIAKEI